MSGDDEPGLPIKLEPCSNGEFRPLPANVVAREAIRRAHAQSDALAARLGMDRRRFLRSAIGAATGLAVLGACSKESGQSGGTFEVPSPSPSPRPSPPPTATTPSPTPPTTTPTADVEAAIEAISGEEFIFDVQGHLLELGPGSTGSAPGFPQASCGDGPESCFDIEHFLDLVLLQSDTSMVMLSAIPFSIDALSPEVMAATIDLADRLCDEPRVLMQGESYPTRVALDEALEAMSRVAENFPIRAFKTYTHAAGPAWRLDDADPAWPQVGGAYLDHVRSLGVPIVAVHKGLSGRDRASSPADIGPAAAAHPDISLLVYHSGFEVDDVEGPYAPETRDVGVNRLLASLDAAGIPPGANVYAELGSTWRTLMTRPDEAAHVLGKLLVRLGEDNVLWGTDSIWYGSPQDQIQAFRAFAISEELQEVFGYPALTPERKAKILGLNAARLFDVDPVTQRCEFTRAELAEMRAGLPSIHRTFGPE